MDNKSLYPKNSDNNKSNSSRSNDYRGGLLSKRDVNRIASAIELGIVRSRGKPTKAPVPWLPILVILTLTAVALGIWGFSTLSHQSVTLSGDFRNQSKFSVKASPDIIQNMTGNVKKLVMSGNDTPIKLQLYLTATQKKGFIDKLKPEWVNDNIVTLDGPTTQLEFIKSTEIHVSVQNAEKISLEQMSDNTTTNINLVSVGRQYLTENVSDDLNVNISVYPPDQQTYGMQLMSADKTFDLMLEPVNFYEASVVIIEVSTNPHKQNLGNKVSFSANYAEFIMNAETRGPKKLEGYQHIEISEIPESLLILGNIVHSLGAKDELDMEFDAPTSVTLTKERINISTDEETCVSAILNNRIELLPSQISMWPSLAQEAYRWLVITFTTTSLMGILKRYTNIPT